MIKKLFSMSVLATLAVTLSHTAFAERCSINVVTSPKVVGGAIFNAEGSNGGTYGTDQVVYATVYKMIVPCRSSYRISASPIDEQSKKKVAYGKYKYKEELVYLGLDDSSVSVTYPTDFPDAPK